MYNDNVIGPGDSWPGSRESESDGNEVPVPDQCDDNYCDELEKKIAQYMTALVLAENAAVIRTLVDSINTLIAKYIRLCGDMEYLDPDDFLGPNPIE